MALPIFLYNIQHTKYNIQFVMNPNQEQNTQKNMGANNPAKILITDDDQFLLDMYAMKFNEQGFQVVPASSGEEALAALKAGGDTFHAALLDLVMPGMDGFDLLKRIREEKIAPNCRFIVLSNLGQPADKKKARQEEKKGETKQNAARPTEA